MNCKEETGLISSLMPLIIVWGLAFPLFGQSGTDYNIELRYDRGIGLYAIHEIKPGETLYKVAKIYHSEIKDIVKANKTLKENDLSPGQRLAIPFNTDRMIYEAEHLQDDVFYQPVYYKVSKKETIFRISRRYFDTTVDALKAKNDLPQLRVGVNQVLFVGWTPADWMQIYAIDERKPIRANQISLSDLDTPLSVPGPLNKKLSETSYSGVAYWNKSSDTRGIFALYNKAPRGTTLAIENPMFDKSVYAEVVGRVPPNTYPNDVMIIVSSDLAKELGALDSRFFVKVRYLQAEGTD